MRGSLALLSARRYIPRTDREGISMPFNNIGPAELIIVLVIALVVIGPKKLPDVGKSLGKGMREFKDSLSGESREEGDGVKKTISRAD